jgi:uncharacterized membrane protein
MHILLRFIAILAWVGVAFLVFLLWRIARFYERSSHQHAYSYFFLLSLLLLMAGAAWYIIAAPMFIGIPQADLLLFLGGGVLVLAILLLKRIMMGK